MRPRIVAFSLLVVAACAFSTSRAFAEETSVESEEPADEAAGSATQRFEDSGLGPKEDDAPLGWDWKSRPESQGDFVPLPDRWRLGFPRWERYPGKKKSEDPYIEGAWWDPYNLNVLKGDYPVIGQDKFLVLTIISDTLFEARRIPTPSNIPADEARSDEFFGQSDQLFLLENFVTSLEFFQGDSVFKPRDWEIRVTPVFNINWVDVGEVRNTGVNPDRGVARTDGHIGWQELFIEYHIGDLSPYYDFWAVRVGVQGFNSDFRGLIFADNNLGVRLFGNWASNRWQWNLAFFQQLEKDTNSALNILDFSRNPFGDGDEGGRQQQVAIANVYRQDTIWKGYTAQLSFHYNRDYADFIHFDRNDFLVRPAVIASVIPDFAPAFKDVDAYYAGWTGDGHIGRLNISHAFYQAFGEETFNPIPAKEVDINAQFGSVELSVDRDWLRPKFTFVYASGDSDALDDDATGFDNILDNTNLAGNGFSYFVRQGLGLLGAGVQFVGRGSLLPNLRSSKIEGQANFVNPGIFVYNVGFDAELTPKLKAIANVSYLQFAKTDVLELVFEQKDIKKSIGIDYSIGLQYRPLLIENVILTLGAAALTPFEGFRETLVAETQYSTFFASTLTY